MKHKHERDLEADLRYITDCLDELMTILKDCIPDAEPRASMKAMQAQFQERFGIDRRG